MELLVAEETVGYGPCLEVDSTSPRYLNLVPLMHQIPANGCLALDYGSSSEGCAGPTAIPRPGVQRPGGRDRAKIDVHSTRFAGVFMPACPNSCSIPTGNVAWRR